MKHSFVLLATLVCLSHIYMSGSALPPCTLAPESQEDFDSLWAGFDINGDGAPCRFLYSPEHGAYYTQNKKMAADDWIISPAVTLCAGKSYAVTATVWNLSTFASDKQDFTVCCGRSQNPDGMTSEVFSETGLTRTSWAVDRSGNVSVDSDGDWYIGLHLTSKSYMGDFALVSFSIEEIVPLPGSVAGLSVSVPADGTLRSVLNWTWPETDHLGGPLDSLGGARIYRSASGTGIVAESCLVAVLDEGGTPGGSDGWEDTDVPSAGIWYYSVVPFNAGGVSPVVAPVAESSWIGHDSGVGNVSDLSAEADPDSETSVRLTWTSPAGSHGGYVDPSAVSYRICRSDNGADPVVIDDGWTGAMPYVDSSIPGLGSYVYTVYTIYGGSVSFGSAKSNAVVTGGALHIPYANSFDSAASTALFSFFHTAGSRDWVYSSSYKALDFWGNNSPGASFAVLPVFSLEAGKSYSIGFTTWVSTSKSPKNLSVRIGSALSEEGLAEPVWQQTVSSVYRENVEVPFSVPADGRYYIAFAVADSSDSNDIYVNALTVTETETAPLPVSDVMAGAAPGGELKVFLSWNNPSMTTAGTEMPVIDRIVISRDGDILATLEDQEGGAAGSYEDTSVTGPGIYTYSIMPCIGDVAGEAAEARSGWVGPDYPEAPAEVVAVENSDGSHTVYFQSVTEGAHGGYIDIAGLTYTISRDGDIIDSGVKESPYTDTDTGLPLGMYTYAVSAVSGGFAGDSAEALPVRGGEALALPYRPDFSSADDFALWTFVNPEGKSSDWKYDASKEALVASFTADNAWAFTPPVRMEKGMCRVSFKATCFNRYPEDFRIYLTRNTDLENLDSVLMIGEFHVESAYYPDVTEASFDVGEAGVYHVGYLLPKYNWTLTLTQADVEQTDVVETGVGGVDEDEDVMLRYCRHTEEILSSPGAVIRVYTLQGVEALASEDTRTSVSTLAPGAYVVVSCLPDGTETRLKFIR